MNEYDTMNNLQEMTPLIDTLSRVLNSGMDYEEKLEVLYGIAERKSGKEHMLVLDIIKEYKDEQYEPINIQ